MPVVRPMDALPLWMDRPASRRRPVQPVAEQELARTLRCVEGVAVARGAVILDESPDRGKTLVERGAAGARGGAGARSDVAVPAAVGPVRAKKNVDKAADLLLP